jgi:hypothetical protein
MRREGYYGPLVSLKVKASALFVLFVVSYGYAQQHHVHDLQGFAVAVLRDLAGAVQQVGQAGGGAAPGTRQPGASATATADIPRDYRAAYRAAAGTCPHLTWTLLAGVGKVETNHGRVPLPGVHSGQNFAGAAGPMQMGNGTGKAGNAWARYGDGVPRHVYQIGPAAKGAARYLCANGVRAGRVRAAVHHYNCGRPYCAVSEGYVRDVFRHATSYAKGRR